MNFICLLTVCLLVAPGQSGLLRDLRNSRLVDENTVDKVKNVYNNGPQILESARDSVKASAADGMQMVKENAADGVEMVNKSLKMVEEILKDGVEKAARYIPIEAQNDILQAAKDIMEIKKH